MSYQNTPTPHYRRLRGVKAPTVAELKRLYQAITPSGHFFDRQTLAFFGDTSQNYGVRAVVRGYRETMSDPPLVHVWELYRRKPVKHGLTSSAYFGQDGSLIP